MKQIDLNSDFAGDNWDSIDAQLENGIWSDLTHYFRVLGCNKTIEPIEETIIRWLRYEEN